MEQASRRSRRAQKLRRQLRTGRARRPIVGPALHTKQDEFVYIIEGEFILVTDAGRETVGPGTCIAFPADTGDGHHFLNATDNDATFLVVGDRTPSDEITYPDIDLELKAGPDGTKTFRHKDGVPYPKLERT